MTKKQKVSFGRKSKWQYWSIWPKFLFYRKIWALCLCNLSHQTVSEKENTQWCILKHYCLGNDLFAHWNFVNYQFDPSFSCSGRFELCVHATFHIKLYQKRTIHNDAFLKIIVRWWCISSLKLCISIHFWVLANIKIDDFIFTRQKFVKMHLCALDFNSFKFEITSIFTIKGNKHNKGDKQTKNIKCPHKSETEVRNH